MGDLISFIETFSINSQMLCRQPRWHSSVDTRWGEVAGSMPGWTILKNLDNLVCSGMCSVGEFPSLRPGNWCANLFDTKIIIISDIYFRHSHPPRPDKFRIFEMGVVVLPGGIAQSVGVTNSAHRATLLS